MPTDQLLAPGARWITNADRARAVHTLAGQLPPFISDVAGVARSGVSPAFMLAELLHLRPHVMSPDGQLIESPHGHRLRHHPKPKNRRLLIVDDTVCSGGTMRTLGAKLSMTRATDYLTAALYACDKHTNLLDFCVETLENPHLLEWNFFNSVYLDRTASDFDGILCDDCPLPDDDHGPRYSRFLHTVKPKYLIRRMPVAMICTARCAQYREQTIEWLSRWGIDTKELVMAETAADHNHPAQFKAEVYKNHPTLVFVESCGRQAKTIADITGKRVICPAEARVYN